MSAGLTEGNSTDFYTGSGAALNAIIVASQDVNNYQAGYLQITGTFNATTKVQGSNDGTNFVDVLVTDISNPSASPSTSITAPGIFYVPTSFRYFQLKITAYVSGTVNANVFFQLDISGDLGPRTANAIQSGTWTVVANEDKNYGAVGSNTLRVAAQVGNATGAADFNAGATGAQTLRTHSNQGAPGTAANAWFEKITDGTNTAAVKAASTAVIATDPALVVGLSPNSPLPAGANNIGSVNAIQSGTWNVNSAFVDVTPATQTITALDAGTSNLTGANGQVFYFGSPTANSAATFALSSIDSVAVQGSLLGAGGTMVVEVSMDGGTFWLRPNVYQVSTQNYSNGFTAPFIAIVNVSGMTHIRVRSTVSWTGTATILVRESLNVRGVTIGDSLPAGANVIGGVIQSGTWTVTAAEDKNYGTVGATTLRVASQIGNSTGAADFNAGATGAQTLRTTANQGTPNTATNAWPVKLTDGTDVAEVKPASTAALATDPSLVVALSPNSPLPAGTNAIGTVKAQLQDNAGAAITLGQKTMASSVPVVLPSDQTITVVSSPLPVSGSKFSFGVVTTAAITTEAVVEKTTYTEPTTNGQRSFASSNAGDAAAGTGARTILLTYLDQTGAGPFTETITLNGVTRVNTVATNVCFIESIKVLTCGSNGSNLGTITMFTLPTAGGTTIATITVGDNQTYWAHHYVASGDTCYISGFSVNNSSTAVGNGGVYLLRARNPTVAGTVNQQISDYHRLYGQSSTATRTYLSPIVVVGPAIIRAYVSPESNPSVVQRASFDYIDN